MGAQTVTGRGAGSAEGSSKGVRERSFVGVEKLIGPRVVAAGKYTLNSGNVTGTAAVYNIAGNVAGLNNIDFRVPLPCVTPISAGLATPTPQADYVITIRDETAAALLSHQIITYNSKPDGVISNTAAENTCLKGFAVILGGGGGAADVIAWTVTKVGD